MTVEEAISAHRTAVVADEANFTDDGVPLDQVAADASGEAETVAFQAFCSVPCLTPADIQAKVAYALAPPVGEREAHASRLTGEDGSSCDTRVGPEPLLILLRSLVVPA